MNEAFKPHENKTRQMLWHGTGSGNLYSILATGLKASPAYAHISGLGYLYHILYDIYMFMYMYGWL